MLCTWTWTFCVVSVDAGKAQRRQAAESSDDSLLQVHEAGRCGTAGECVCVWGGGGGGGGGGMDRERECGGERGEVFIRGRERGSVCIGGRGSVYTGRGERKCE